MYSYFILEQRVIRGICYILGSCVCNASVTICITTHNGFPNFLASTKLVLYCLVHCGKGLAKSLTVLGIVSIATKSVY